MECFGTTDFDNNIRLITLSTIIISGLHCTINLPYEFVFCQGLHLLPEISNNRHDWKEALLIYLLPRSLTTAHVPGRIVCLHTLECTDYSK